jgi:hypothetical protein
MATHVEKIQAKEDVRYWTESLNGATKHRDQLVSQRDKVLASSGNDIDWLEDRISEIDTVITNLDQGKRRAETRFTNLLSG